MRTSPLTYRGGSSSRLSSSPVWTLSANGSGNCLESFAAPSLSELIAPRRARNSRLRGWGPSFVRCLRSSTPPAASWRLPEQALDERLQAAVLAARLAPPTYITKELGEKPLNRTKQRAWDRGVTEIEGYRLRQGIKDPNRALGQERAREIEQRAVLRRVHEAQRALGLGQHASRKRDLGAGDRDRAIRNARQIGRTLESRAERERISVLRCPGHPCFRRGACETEKFDARRIRSETIRTRNA